MRRYIFLFENNMRLTPLNLYWQVEIINNFPVSICIYRGRGERRGRCVYNDPKLVIWSPGYRSRLALIYRIIIQPATARYYYQSRGSERYLCRTDTFTTISNRDRQILYIGYIF